MNRKAATVIALLLIAVIIFAGCEPIQGIWNWNDGRNGSPICGFLKRGRPEMLATSSNMSDQLW